MKMQSKSFDEEFKSIRRQYAVKLVKQVKEIVTKWQLLLSNSTNHELLVDIYREVHKISGSAGTFGFGTVGNIADNLELQLKLIVDNDRASLLHDTGIMSQKFESLLQEVETLTEK